MKRIAVIVCLIAVAGCQRKKKLEVTDDQPPPGRPFPVVAPEDIGEVRIEPPGQPAVVLHRDGQRWLMVEPEPGVVDAAAISFALREISRIEFDPEPVGGEDDWARLGVTDGEVATLRVTAGGRPLPALHLGPRRHLRVGDAPAVWRAHSIDHFTFNRELRLWR